MKYILAHKIRANQFAEKKIFDSIIEAFVAQYSDSTAKIYEENGQEVADEVITAAIAPYFVVKDTSGKYVAVLKIDYENWKKTQIKSYSKAELTKMLYSFNTATATKKTEIIRAFESTFNRKFTGSRAQQLEQMKALLK